MRCPACEQEQMPERAWNWTCPTCGTYYERTGTEQMREGDR